MKITDLLDPDGIVAGLKVTSKKQLLQELAGRATQMTGADERSVFETLLARERLGTTGVGNGVAIPHGKLPDIERLCAVFARLEHPVDYDAIDDQPVDLVFLLLAPEAVGADHLKALSRISRLLRNDSIREKLRGSENADALYALLTEPATSHAA